MYQLSKILKAAALGRSKGSISVRRVQYIWRCLLALPIALLETGITTVSAQVPAVIAISDTAVEACNNSTNEALKIKAGYEVLEARVVSSTVQLMFRVGADTPIRTSVCIFELYLGQTPDEDWFEMVDYFIEGVLKPEPDPRPISDLDRLIEVVERDVRLQALERLRVVLGVEETEAVNHPIGVNNTALVMPAVAQACASLAQRIAEYQDEVDFLLGRDLRGTLSYGYFADKLNNSQITYYLRCL